MGTYNDIWPANGLLTFKGYVHSIISFDNSSDDSLYSCRRDKKSTNTLVIDSNKKDLK